MSIHLENMLKIIGHWGHGYPGHLCIHIFPHNLISHPALTWFYTERYKNIVIMQITESASKGRDKKKA